MRAHKFYILLFLTTQASAGEDPFISTWKQFLSYGQYGEKVTNSYKSVVTHFTRQAVKKKIKIAKEGEKEYLIYRVAYINNKWLQLYVAYAPENWSHAEYEKCVNNSGYLRYRGVYTKLPINPLCSETAILEDLDITLHFVDMKKFPYVSVTTNGPACIPSWLYQLDERSNRFRQIAKACGG